MEFWTVMWITVLSGPLDGSTSGLIYPSVEACEASIENVSETISYDFNVACNQTDIPSATLRPKRNPIYMEN